MAIIGSPWGSKRPQYSKPLIKTDFWRGLLRVSKWPRHRNRRPSAWENILRQQFREWRQVVKRMHWREQTPMREAIKRHNKSTRGLNGSAAIRADDWLLMLVAGRAWAFELEDGTTVYPAAAARDVSDTLDWLDPVPGGVCARGPNGWGSTIPCIEGSVLTTTPSGGRADCCDGPEDRFRHGVV